ncbi:MAG: histidine kinase [Candidatus Cloacimonetes bacterium]|nr:histidine kinase [Candidatus Cloacimonadota bacterium]
MVEQDRMTMLRWWAMIRWFMVVVTFSIGMLHISFSITSVHNILFFSVFSGIVALNIYFHFQSKVMHNWVTIFQVILDIIFATIVVHLTGGIGSSFVWFYLIGIITAALTIPHSGGLIAGLIGSLSLVILIILYQNKILIASERDAMDIANTTVYILSYTGLFCGVAMIASYLSDHLSAQTHLKDQFALLKQENQALKDDASLLSKQMAIYTELRPVLHKIAHLDHDINTPLCIISLSIGRVKRLGFELKNSGLQKSSDEITEAMNKINILLQQLNPLKRHPLIQDIGPSFQSDLFPSLIEGSLSLSDPEDAGADKGAEGKHPYIQGEGADNGA